MPDFSCENVPAGSASFLFPFVAGSSWVEIRDPRSVALAMRMPDATRVQNHAIATLDRTTGKRLSSLSSDAPSSEILKGLFTMKVKRRAKATAMTPIVKTEASDRLVYRRNQGR